MKCENCGKNEVAFLYQSNVNGHVTEKRLCADCAEKLGYTRRIAAHNQRMMQSFNSFWNEPFGSFFSPLPLLDRMRGMLDDPFDDFFSEMPALGTPEKKQEPDTLVSPDEKERYANIRRRNQLQAEMDQAVARQEFERAAQLRDQLKALEGPKNTEDPQSGAQS